MQTHEFEGKNTEDAIENASRELNLPVEDLNIDIIEPGSAGIFGLVGGKKAKIRVTFQDTPEVDVEEDLQVNVQRNFEVGVEQDLQVNVQRDPGVEVEPDLALDVERDLAVAKQALTKILSLIPVETNITAGHIDGKINLDIEGDKSGLLIGRKGKTLDALQYIVNKIVNKALDKKTNVVVDSENYRKRREDSLIHLALKMGDKAKRIRKPVSTNLLNPHDRRIVHLALREDNRLDTRSRGEGLMKKVVIIPKK